MITFVAFTAAAFVLWSFMEYVIHRFAFHERRGKNYGSREHHRHHASRDYRVWNNPEAWVGVVTPWFMRGSAKWWWKWCLRYQRP